MRRMSRTKIKTKGLKSKTTSNCIEVIILSYLPNMIKQLSKLSMKFLEKLIPLSIFKISALKIISRFLQYN